VDGLAKVKGTAIYGDDITLPGMLFVSAAMRISRRAKLNTLI
jgi:CO/xanthine dehydrogenase Mo-binding subunit